MSGRTLEDLSELHKRRTELDQDLPHTRRRAQSTRGGLTADLDRRALNDVPEAVAHQDPGDLSQTTQVSDIHVRQGDPSESPP